MATTSPWHSIRHTLVALGGDGAPCADRVYHDDDECPEGRAVELRYREAGTGHLPHCDECRRRGSERSPERAASPYPDYPVPVVDSGLYQDALDAIAQNSGDAPGANGAGAPGDHHVIARLVPETEVVRVVIHGLRVGYLNGADAQRYRQHLPDPPLWAPALIVGTWDWDPRKPGTRSYEVWLALRLAP